MITQYTEFLTKAEFLWLRKTKREELKSINEAIRFLKDHRKEAKAKELYEAEKQERKHFNTHFFGIYRPIEVIQSTAMTRRREAREIHGILALFNGIPLEENSHLIGHPGYYPDSTKKPDFWIEKIQKLQKKAQEAITSNTKEN